MTNIKVLLLILSLSTETIVNYETVVPRITYKDDEQVTACGLLCIEIFHLLQYYCHDNNYDESYVVNDLKTSTYNE